MRAATPILAALILTLSGSGAIAAPTCRDADGNMARCGTARAMPVGWAPLGGGAAGRRTGEADASDDARLIGLTVFLAGLFGLIALMPDFEGRWDRQAGDDERGG